MIPLFKPSMDDEEIEEDKEFNKIVNVIKNLKMKLTKTKFDDLLIIEPEVFNDEGGHFSRIYNKTF